MKRLLTALMLCMVSIMASSQTWDVIGENLSKATSLSTTGEYVTLHYEDVSGGYKTITIDTCVNGVTPRSIYRQVPDSSSLVVKDIAFATIPQPIYERYTYGCKLMKAGWCNFGVGLALSIVGGFIYGNGVDKHDVAQVKAGTALLAGGGTLVSFSLPMLWFGDNMKRETNCLYRTINMKI